MPWLNHKKRHLRTKDISSLGITRLIYSKSWEASPVTPKCHQLQIQRLNSFKHGISRVWGLLHGFYDFSGGTHHPLKTASAAPSSWSFSRFSLSSNSSSSSNFFLYPLPSPTLQAVSSSASRVFQVCDNRGLTLKTEKEVMERWTQVRRYWIPINMNLYFIFLSDLLSFNIQIQTPLETNCYWVKNCLCTLKEYFVNANSSPAYMCLVDVCVCIKGWYFRALEERVARERVRKIITKQGLLLPLCTPVSFLQGVWVIG